MERLMQELRYAVRRLLKRPVFTLIAVLSLAIGIGANTAIFTLVNAIILREPHLERPEELVDVYRATAGFSHATFSYPDLEDLRHESREVFTEVAGSRLSFVQTDVEGGVEMQAAELVTGNFFPLLGVRAEVGRTLLPEDDVSPGGHPVVMLGYSYWQQRFAGDPAIVGENVRLNGEEYTVVGVAPRSYVGNLRGLTPAIYAPMMMVAHINPSDYDELTTRGSQNVFAKARLVPGVSLLQAQGTVDRLAESLQRTYPEHWLPDSVITLVATDRVIMNPMIDRILVPAAVLMMVVVGLVLLIACANLGSFLLAQALDRRREVATRLALGANRGNLVRQFLTETMLLALMGGGAGLLVSSGVLGALISADLPLPFPITLDLALDPAVLGFSAVLTLATGLLFGLAPALAATRTEVAPVLKDESTGGGPAKKITLRNTLVVVQVAVSLVLLVAAGLFLRSLQARLAVDPGFGYEPAAILNVQAVPTRYSEEEARVFFRTLRVEAAALPGIEAVGLSADLPLSTLNNQMMRVTVDGVEPPPGQDFHLIDWAEVDAGFFDAAGVPIVRGRPFAESDGPDSVPVAIVSETLTQRFWPESDALGRTFRSYGEEVTVVGIARDVKVRSLGEEPRPFVYRPHEQSFSSAMTVVARTSTDAERVLLDLIALARRLDPELLIYEAKTMERHLAVMLLPHRLSALAVGAFGVLALLLSSIGLYGVVSYSVSTRSREVGIRMSLGAGPRSVVGMLMQGGMKLVALGGGIGLVVSILSSRLLGGLLFGIEATDPIAFLVVPAVLVVVALLAAWIPAYRACAVDPVKVLRSS